MKVANWRSKEIFKALGDRAYDNANNVMDDVVAAAKRLCPSPGATNITRPPGFSKAFVSFTPKTGRNKGKLIQFHTEKRWIGRSPGALGDTIRRVNKRGQASSSIRVYAGNFKIYWAFMVEKGTASTGWGGPARAQPFLRPAFNSVKKDVLKKVASGGGI